MSVSPVIFVLPVIFVAPLMLVVPVTSRPFLKSVFPSTESVLLRVVAPCRFEVPVTVRFPLIVVFPVVLVFPLKLVVPVTLKEFPLKLVVVDLTSKLFPSTLTSPLTVNLPSMLVFPALKLPFTLTVPSDSASMTFARLSLVVPLPTENKRPLFVLLKVPTPISPLFMAWIS